MREDEAKWIALVDTCCSETLRAHFSQAVLTQYPATLLCSNEADCKVSVTPLHAATSWRLSPMQTVQHHFLPYA